MLTRAATPLWPHPCAACAQSHPIFNFIFQYYFIEKRILLRWTPGPGVLVRGAAPVEPLLWQGRGWQAHADGGHYDPRQLHSGKPGRLIGLRRARDILRRTAERAAHLRDILNPDILHELVHPSDQQSVKQFMKSTDDKAAQIAQAKRGVAALVKQAQLVTQVQ